MPRSTQRPLALLVLLLALLVHPAFAQIVTGKVVGVSDGDTLTLLTAEKRQYKIRLNGIDAPETGQPFGTAAKQFTSKAAFGKDVEAVVKDTDRYGRTVAVVLVGGTNLNQSLVRNGYAWWYRQYAPNDAALKQLEYEARAAKRGLWAEAKTAIAPWDWRRGARPTAKVAAKPQQGVRSSSSPPRAAKPSLTAPRAGTVYVTNTGAKYHEGGCRHLRRSQIAVSLKEAEVRGYDPCKHCH